MQKILFFVFLILAFSLLISMSYQSKPITEPSLESEKIDPELRELKSLNSEEKVEVIVWLNKNKSTESLEEIGNVTHEYSIIPAVAMEVSVNELENLAKEPNVEEIVPDRIVSAFRLESMAIIKATNASSTFNVNGTGVNISIIDTGIFNHTEFQSPNRIIKQKCYCNAAPGDCCPDGTAESDNATDNNGHGTHVSGIAAGKGDGYTHGVATNASLFAVKVLNSSGSGKEADVIAGIDWAVQNGAKVISLSLGGALGSYQCYDFSSSEAVDNATKQGVVVVIAAGNSGPPSQTIGAPACAKRAITVGSTDDNDVISSFSSRGPMEDNRTKPDLTAPGEGINSTNNTGVYYTLSGTSQATPHVAGVAALVIQRFNQINGYYPDPDRVKAILITAVNTTSQRNNIYGAGRIDAYEALRIINFTKNNTISAGEEHHYKINVTSSDFKMTLYWPEDIDTSNNLNLFVGNGTYNYSYPTDANDTVEQVFLTDARLDFWDIYVVSNASANQSYYLASNMEIFNDTTAPSLILEKPENITYTSRTGIPINFTTDSTNHTIWYKLDGGDEIKIIANSTFNVNSDGSHYITLYMNDSYDNINQSTRFFTVDTTPPLYSNNSTNSTITGQLVEFRLRWTDNLGLNGYIFSLDNGTTTFENYTWTSMIGTGNWSNVSKVVNSTVGTSIRWIVYANDTINNWNRSETYGFNTTSNNNPTWSNNVFSPSSPTYSANQNYQFNITWSDDVALNTVFIEHNFTGSSTPHNTSFSGNESGVFYFNVSDLAAKAYVWRSYANDSSNNFNSTSQFIYTVSKSSSEMQLYLNETRDDEAYLQNKTANITVVLNVQNKYVNLTSNMSGWVLQTGVTPLINYTNLTTLGSFNMTGYWLGDENYTADSESWFASVVTTTVATTTTTNDGDDQSSGTSPSNIKKISRIFTQLTPSNRTEWVIGQVNICIAKIEIEVKNTLNNVKITVAKLDGKPSTISANAPGKVYQYLEINKTIITDTDIKNLKFNFTVNKSWVTSNNIDKVTIALNRYYNDRWYTLPTNRSGENSNYFYFVSASPGFSVFAVTGEAPVTTTTIETTTVTSSGTTTIASEENVGPRTEEKIGGAWSYWYIIIIIIPIAVVAAFFGLRMSSKTNEEAYEKLKMKWAFERLKRKWSNRRS